jgi:hypothetical protein
MASELWKGSNERRVNEKNRGRREEYVSKKGKIEEER